MTPSRREQLEELALKRLHDPANDSPTQMWAYVNGSDHTLFGWCPWNAYDDGGPAVYGIPDDCDLPWSVERRQQLEKNDADITKTELREWRRERCRHEARDQPTRFAVIKPMKIENDKLEAYEVWFDCEVNFFREIHPTCLAYLTPSTKHTKNPAQGGCHRMSASTTDGAGK